MHRFLYWSLAWQSIQKSRRITVPFIAGSSLMVMMLYSLLSLSVSSVFDGTFGETTMLTTLNLGVHVVEFFTVLIFLYINSVWMKNRAQENGLYSILGMEKRHLMRIIFYELLISYASSLVIGILLGIVLDKILLLVLGLMLPLNIPKGFSLTWSAVWGTALWIGVCYLILLAVTLFSLLRHNPLEEMKTKSTSEKPVKSRWILAVLGVCSLGSGYWMAVTIEDPVQALFLFFAAVVCVIIGTYLLFIFGSTVILNSLQKNKSFYYQPSHFISISTMKYRLKANAASLASLAILSTMVLVTLSTVITLFAGMNSTLDAKYSGTAMLNMDLNIPYASRVPSRDSLELQAITMHAAAKAGLHPQNPVTYQEAFASYHDEQNKLVTAEIIDLADLNRLSGQNISLGDHQILAFDSRFSNGQKLTNEDTKETFEVVRADFALPDSITHRFLSDTQSRWFAIELNASQNASVYPSWTVQFEDGITRSAASPESVSDDTFMEASDAFTNNLNLDAFLTAHGTDPNADLAGLQYSLSFREVDRRQGLSVYAAFLFAGLYLSALFTLVMILIMYYKQISEGFDDQKRFAIMQKVGLERKQIKHMINEQVLVMFFLPLVTAIVHMGFAYTMLSKIIDILSPSAMSIYFLTTAGVIAVFALLYIIIYRLTANVYYRLVGLPTQSNA